MAATNITKKEDYTVFPRSERSSLYKVRAKRWDVSLNGGLGTQFAHPIMDLNVGEYLVSLTGIVTTAFVGSTATATFQLTDGPTALTGIIPVGQLAVSKSFRVLANNQTGSVITDSSGGTANTTLTAFSAATASNPTAPTAYSAHGSGATTVTSTAATDLDTTAAALATLVTEVTTYETAISANIVDIAAVVTNCKNNFADLALAVNGLITPVTTYAAAFYRKTTATTIEVDVNTADFTAGQMILIAEIMDIGAIDDQV